MGKQIETINRELQQDWTLPSVYQRALRNVQHYGQTTMMELVHFMFIQARYVFRGRIADEHHHNLFHNFIMPVIAAYGPAGECVVEEVEEMMPRIKQYIDWVANEMGVGFVSLVLHLMSHCDIIVKDAGGMRTNTMRYETSNFLARCVVCAAETIQSMHDIGQCNATAHDVYAVKYHAHNRCQVFGTKGQENAMLIGFAFALHLIAKEKQIMVMLGGRMLAITKWVAGFEHCALGWFWMKLECDV